MIHIEPKTNIDITTNINNIASLFQRGFDSAPRCMKNTSCTTNCAMAKPTMYQTKVVLLCPFCRINKYAIEVRQIDNTNPIVYDQTDALWAFVSVLIIYNVPLRYTIVKINIQIISKKCQNKLKRCSLLDKF